MKTATKGERVVGEMLTLYFSGTGNSAYIAREFARRMGAACHSVEEDLDFSALMAGADTIAVCYPIYGSCVPRLMREFASDHAGDFAGKRLILFCTQMMFSGDGAKAFARLLPGCENRVVYAEHFSMPNNICNFFLFPIREGERRRKKAAADKKLERVCREVEAGVVRRRGWGPGSRLLGRVQNASWPALEEKRRGAFRADEDCIRCGLCVERCPVGNLTLGARGVEQRGRCMMCYRCVNLCPRQAATVALRAKPKRQYHGIDPENT